MHLCETCDFGVVRTCVREDPKRFPDRKESFCILITHERQLLDRDNEISECNRYSGNVEEQIETESECV